MKLQLSLDVNEDLAEGHILFPENNTLTLEGNEYDLTGLRREMEWMFGRPIPQQQPKNEEISTEEAK